MADMTAGGTHHGVRAAAPPAMTSHIGAWRWCVALLTAGPLLAGVPTSARVTTQERIRALAALAREYPWFARQKEALLEKCERRMGQASEELWRDMPGQCIPRRTGVNTEHGCPNCGKAIHEGYGYYPWRSTPAHPWKVQCPKCRERFPKNDFLAYYRSGIDEEGVFDPQRADKSLLYNQDHPDPADPKHEFGVDPGAGYRTPEGVVYTFVACYNQSRIWGKPWDRTGITSIALDFAYAYLLTGDIRYARKAAVIVARIATLYPEMDYGFWTKMPEYNPSGRYIPGKILDRIWENFLVRRLLRAYDLVHDAVVADREFCEFLAQRTGHLPLSKDRFTNLVEQLYLKEIFRCAQNGVLWGNTGMTEENVALLALVTRDRDLRERAAQWLFSPRTITGYNTAQHRQHGGGLLDLACRLTRDGFSWESGGYCEILPKTLFSIYPAVSKLRGTDQSAVHQAVVRLCGKRLSAFFRNHYALTCLGRFKPYWGDNGNFCAPAYREGPDPALYFGGFLSFGDRQLAKSVKSLLASRGRDAEGSLRVDDLFFVPPDVGERMQTFAAASAGVADESVNLTGRGLVVLKQGRDKFARALWTHYGNNHTCHNHPDTLSMGLFAFGRDILPGLGYPNLRKRHLHTHWHMSTISDNTVVVDGQERMQRMEIGDQKLFAESDLLSLYVIDAPALYESVPRYRRCVGLVRVSERDFYVADFFEVEGGKEHVYSFHSGEGEVAASPDLAFREQARGTYAGEDVEYGQETYRYSEQYGWRWGNGFQYLYDVKRSGPTEDSAFTWSLKNTHDVCPFGDDVRCRLNLLSPVDEIAIAKGKPPQNTKGNPDHIYYVLAKRTSEEALASHFVGVVEAYLAGHRPIRSVRKLKKLAGGPFASAVEVTLADGRRDLIAKSADESEEAKFEGGLSMTGLFCLLRLDPDGNVAQYHASMAREISLDGRFRMSFVPSAASRVTDFDKSVADRSTVTLADTISVPARALKPLWADITPTDKMTDGSYRVLDTWAEAGRTTLHLDTDSFIVGPKDKSVFGHRELADAFRYAFTEGAQVVIPFSYHGKRPR